MTPSLYDFASSGLGCWSLEDIGTTRWLRECHHPLVRLNEEAHAQAEEARGTEFVVETMQEKEGMGRSVSCGV